MTMKKMDDAIKGFETLNKLANADLKSEAVSIALIEVVKAGLQFLTENCFKASLNSEVPGKSYFEFHAKTGKKTSRPVNAYLFDEKATTSYAKKILRADAKNINRETIARVLYSSAMAYCCTADLLKNQDRKTPGTFFEIMVGHLFARTFKVNPDKKIKVQEFKITLPTDFVFDLGRDKSLIHLPIKTSTRERVIQVWAHQRVLDGVSGVNRFRGILVCINETNKKSKTNSVVEVCLPGQWAIYQKYIAQLHRVYYLDIPEKYASLNKTYPFIQVKGLASFFGEAEKLVSAPPF